MNAVDSIGKTIAYIEEHMDGHLDVDTLAAQAALSPFYFHRLFTRVVGMTVMDYVKARRLTAAAKAIRSFTEPLHAISRSVGYVNYESFSRDFKRKFSVSPAVFRADPSYAVLVTPVFDTELAVSNLDVGDIHTCNGMAMQINTVQLDKPLYAIGISKLAGLTCGKDDPGMLWGLFTDEIKAGILNQVTPHIEFGIGLSNYISKGFTYIAARQVTSLDDVPDGYTSFAVSPGTYAECAFEAEDFIALTNEALCRAGDYMLRRWLPGNGRYRFKGGMTVEIYDERSFSGNPPSIRYWFPVEIMDDRSPTLSLKN